MRELQHDFWHNLRLELGTGPHWRDRAVVLAYAVIAGAVVVGFTLLAEVASSGFAKLTRLEAAGRWLPLALTPALTVVLLWWTRRFAPGGSAIVPARERESATTRRGREGRH
jgi:H+/Cl- antiporter ClcA